MPSESTNVFVSYSHADVRLVAPVVKLLRVNKSLVFQDIDGIQPGKRWRSEIAKGMAESHLVVVFWCDHASRSDEVSKEWKAAVEQDKDLLPLLLDATPLPQELSEFQWIDFRAMVGANHSSIDSPADDARASELPSSASAKSGPWLSLGGIAAVLAAAVVGVLFTWESGDVGVPAGAPRDSDSPPGQPFPAPPEFFDMFLSGDILLPLALVLAVMGCVAWVVRWRSKRGRPIESTRTHSREIERHIASEIEAEILRRTALRHDAGA